MGRTDMAVPIGERGHHEMPKRRADADGNHVLFDILAKAQPRVEAIGHDVPELVVDRDLCRDPRMHGKESRQPLREEGREPHDPRGRIAKGGEVR